MFKWNPNQLVVQAAQNRLPKQAADQMIVLDVAV